MKKASVFLIALALLAVSVPMFADAPVVKGTMMWFGNWDILANPVGINAGAVQARVKVDTMVDKNNEVYIELRGEGQTAQWGGGGNTSDFNLYNFKVISNLTGAMGMDLPVTVKLIAGYWDQYMTNWWYSESTGWGFYYGGPNAGGLNNPTAAANWSNKLVNQGPVQAGAFQLDIGAGPVTLHYYNALDLKNIMIGAEGNFGMIGAFLSYGMYNLPAVGAAKGDLSAEFKLDVPEMMGVKLVAYPYFRYGLGDSIWTGGLSIGADVSMVHLAIFAQLDSVTTFDHYGWEASIAPMAGAKVWVNGYLDGALPTTPLAGIDIGVSNKFGAANVIIGYLVGRDKANGQHAVPLYGDNPAYKNGLYAGVDISF